MFGGSPENFLHYIRNFIVSLMLIYYYWISFPSRAEILRNGHVEVKELSEISGSFGVEACHIGKEKASEIQFVFVKTTERIFSSGMQLLLFFVCFYREGK